MNSKRFILTPGAIRDFREIYAREGLTRAQAVDALQSSMHSASWEHSKAEGSQVFRSAEPRRHYLLVGQAAEAEAQPVLAVASLDNQDPKGWWLPACESVIGFGPHPGAELRLAREALGLSVEDLSLLLKVPGRRLEAWERGEIKSWRALRKVARLVGKLHETRILARARAGSSATDRLRSLGADVGRGAGL